MGQKERHGAEQRNHEPGGCRDQEHLAGLQVRGTMQMPDHHAAHACEHAGKGTGEEGALIARPERQAKKRGE